MINYNYSDTTRRAIKNYGQGACEQAYFWHVRLGYGASGIANEIGLGGIRTTQQADAAINAGHEIELTRLVGV